MCWISYDKPEVKTAEEDIPVVKMLIKEGDRLYSPVMGMGYILNIEYFQQYLNLVEENDKYNITKGFHSMSSNIRIEKKYLSFFDTTYLQFWSRKNNKLVWYFPIKKECVLARCIIPKGSTYCINDNDEYASTSIKVISVEDVLV